MPKTGDTGINLHIQEELTNLTECLKIEFKDGDVLGFTNHDIEIEYDSLLYEPESSFLRTNAQYKDNLSVTNMNLDGIINSDHFSKDDIRAGKFSNAELYYFVLNWGDISDGIIKMNRFFIGNISLKKGVYIAELKGLEQKLNKNFLSIFTAECRAHFGVSSTGCKFDLDTVKEEGEIDSVTNNRLFTVTGLDTHTDNYFNQGKIKFTSGLNNGLTQEIKIFSGTPDTVTLFLMMPFTVANGDTFDIWPGCDKSFNQCKIYDQVPNYRGFPHLIGKDNLYKYPNARA